MSEGAGGSPTAVPPVTKRRGWGGDRTFTGIFYKPSHAFFTSWTICSQAAKSYNATSSRYFKCVYGWLRPSCGHAFVLRRCPRTALAAPLIICFPIICRRCCRCLYSAILCFLIIWLTSCWCLQSEEPSDAWQPVNLPLHCTVWYVKLTSLFS